ncbi:MAG: hypothetical protein IIW38_03615 [Alistipes sp.]|nr:hypothetical protein [Alistipes sp.]
METKELNEILILLLKGLGAQPIQAAILMVEISTFRLQQEMAKWALTFYEKADTLTLQNFSEKVDELIAQKQSTLIAKE